MRRRLALLESIVESIDGSVFSLDPEFRYTSFNQVHADAMRALYGSEVALGRSLFDCQTVEEHRRTSRGYLERALAGETVAVEAQAGDPRFVQHHTQLTHAPVRDEHGSVVGVAVSARDISDRRRAETELKEREEQLQAVIDNSPFGMHMYRLEGDDRLVFTGCNQTAGDMLGLDHASLVGLTLEEAFPGNADADTAVAYHSIARDGGRYESYEYAYDAEGISGVYEIHAFRFGPRQMAVYFRDITKRRSLELALEERERMLTTLLGNLPGMAYRCANDEAWTDEFVSAGAEELLGYSVESKLGGPAPSLTGQIHPDDLERVRRETDEAVARDEQWQYVYRITTADGVPKWVMERGVGVRDESGEVVALEGFLQDVTAQHENEERLAAAAARWRHTFDAMRDSVAVFDADGRLVSSNAATAARTGRLEEDMIGRPCHEVFHGAGGFTETCPFLQSRESHAVEETILEQAGRWSRVTFQPLLSGEGVFQGGVHVVSDITELMLTEQRLRESLGRLEVMTEGAIATIARAVEVRDPYTAGH